METDKEYSAFGPCRCCSTRGRHRDIAKEYKYNGASEVYSDIILDCFNLFLSSSPQASSLICNTCVQKLRNASEFKSMVVSAEQKLMDSLDSNSTIFLNEPKQTTDVSVEIKSEITVKCEMENLSDEEDINDEQLKDDEQFKDDDRMEYGDVHSDNDFVEGEAELLARFSSEVLMPLPTRLTLFDTCPQYVRHLDSLKDKVIKASDISKLLTETTTQTVVNKVSFFTEKVMLMNNMFTIIKYSNVTPFKSRKRNGFPCFYCSLLHDNLATLQEHQKEQHKRIDAKRVLSKFGSESLLLYVDVTDLACTICNQTLPNMNELKTHLIKTHGKKINLEIADRIIPFKIGTTDFGVCQVCGFNFETFGAVERHMNVHFRNYVCKDCGSGYVTKLRLKVHTKSMHADGNYPCEVCHKVFNNQQKHKNHVDHVHKMIKRFKCLKCPERFTEYFRRQKHMVYAHGVEPISYKCNVCDRSFQIRYALSRHMKRDHLEEKNYQCEICSYKCFSNNELREHMIKHTGERVHECSVCKKAYARKKTLREHMRIHSNDRRFTCVVCGQAFIQKCSLKGHIKTHHLEYSIEHKI